MLGLPKATRLGTPIGHYVGATKSRISGALISAFSRDTVWKPLAVRINVDESSNVAIVKTGEREYRLERAGHCGSLYQQRRVALGLPYAASDPLIIDDQGEPLQTGQLQQFLRRSRSVRMNIMFNTSMCKGLFRTRYGGSSSPDDDDDL